jgi:antitoxin MazE
MKVKVAKWGNSLGLRLPKAAVEAVRIRAGAELELTVEGNDLRLRPPAAIPRYRLADLLAEMDRLGPHNEPETVEWGRDVGSEIIDDAYSRSEIKLDDILSGAKAPQRDAAPPRQRNSHARKRRRHRVG